MTLFANKTIVPGAALAAALFCVLSGCAAPGHVPVAPTASLQPAVPSENTDRLDRLIAARNAADSAGDYILGPGDVVTVKAFDLDEVNQRVRVDGNGDITLPLLNTVPVAGHSVAQVQEDLTKRLGEYMFTPRVTVFVEEYRSQQVAVQGAVHHPGMVNQQNRSTTISDTLAAAGGPTPEAGSRIVLIPVESRHGAEIGILDASAATSPMDNQLAGAIVIDTHESDEQTRRRFLDLPVRAGDVIWVPMAGKFIAEGWLAKPGVYPLTSGLTVRGAIATAGGFTFPAKPSTVRIYHPGTDGITQMRQVNYSDVAALRSPDVFLHEGDVVSVAASPLKLPAWFMYRFIADMVHLGMGVKMAP